MCKTWLLPLALAPLFIACGSLTQHERHQYVMVRSNPPGATIYYRGKNVGTTPAFIEIRRENYSALEVGFANEKKLVGMPSKYRWNVFWYNFAWLPFAPVGWTVDLITGGAWKLSDPKVVELDEKLRPKAAPSSNLVAIAPPKAENSDLSDEAAQLWSERLTKYYPSLRFVPYKQSLSEFTSNGYDYDGRPGREDEYEIFGRLKINDVFESEFKETDQGVELFGRFRNVFSGNTSQENKLTAVPTLNKEETPWQERWKSFIHLVPNTLGIEWSTSDTQVESDKHIYKASSVGNNAGVEAVFPYLSAISLTRVQSPRLNRTGRFNFDFVPTVRFSYKRIEFPDFVPFRNTEFVYSQIGIGLGPEIGWVWGPNYVYLNLIPIWAWHRLAWYNGDNLRVSSLGAVTLRNEIGYLYFFNRNFSGRVFSKTTATPPQMWNSAVQDLAPGSPDVSTGTDFSVGIMFAYTMAPQRKMHTWNVKSEKPN